MANRWKSDQAERTGDAIDDNLPKSVCTLMAMCATLIAFIDSALRYLLLDETTLTELVT